MKNSIKYFGFLLVAVFGLQMHAQENSFWKSDLFNRDFENYRYPDQRGINEFGPATRTLLCL